MVRRSTKLLLVCAFIATGISLAVVLDQWEQREPAALISDVLASRAPPLALVPPLESDDPPAPGREYQPPPSIDDGMVRPPTDGGAAAGLVLPPPARYRGVVTPKNLLTKPSA